MMGLSGLVAFSHEAVPDWVAFHTKPTARHTLSKVHDLSRGKQFAQRLQRRKPGVWASGGLNRCGVEARAQSVNDQQRQDVRGRGDEKRNHVATRPL